MRLGGAAAGFVIFFLLLVRYYPGIVRLVAVDPAYAQPVSAMREGKEEEIAEVRLSPSTQFISERDFERLDRNDYIILNDSFPVAFRRSSDPKWEVRETSKFETVGITDHPVASRGRALLEAGGLSTGSSRHFAVRLKSRSEVRITGESEIDGISVSAHPYGDLATVKAVARGIFGEMTDDLSEADWLEVQQSMIQQHEAWADSTLPIERTISSAVYVSVLYKSMLPSGGMFEFLNPSLFLRAVTTAGIQIGTTRRGHVYMSLDDEVYTINASTKLKNVEVDGKATDFILNVISFIVGGDAAVYQITLVYPSFEPIDVFEELQDFLDAIRIAG